jgi:hypothetical protein
MPINSRSASVPGKRAGISQPGITQITERSMNGLGSERPNPAGLDRLVSAQNIARYRALRDPNTDARQRRTILGLLQQEFARLNETAEIPVTTQEKRPR